MNILELKTLKERKRRLAMVTCYDYWSARILAETAVDLILVGDSGAMVMHGFDDTIPATVEMMCTHVAAVRRGAPKKLIVADLPFMAFRSDLATNIAGVRQLMQAGAHAVKLEGFEGNAEFITHLVNSGVPVMGHLGLTPQSVNVLGGFRVQGRGDEPARRILAQARGLEDAGCFSLVLECVPGDLAAEITSTLKISTIGIGAGAGCDGQVLVVDDMLGLFTPFKPKFVKRYANLGADADRAIAAYAAEVRARTFPAPEHMFGDEAPRK